MKLLVKIMLTYDTDGLIDPTLAREYLQNCHELRKINSDYVEDVEVTVIGELTADNSNDTEFFDNCDREGDSL